MLTANAVLLVWDVSSFIKPKAPPNKKKSLGITAIDNCAADSAIVLTTSHQPINAKARVRSQASPCGTYDE